MQSKWLYNQFISNVIIVLLIIILPPVPKNVEFYVTNIYSNNNIKKPISKKKTSILNASWQTKRQHD